MQLKGAVSGRGASVVDSEVEGLKGAGGCPLSMEEGKGKRLQEL